MYSVFSRLMFWRSAFLAIWFGATLAAPVQAAEPVLTIGLLPNVSARVNAVNYRPMQDYFESALKRKVAIATANSFPAFSAATLNGDYQIVITAPNLGRVAQLDGKWDPVAIFEPGIPGLLVANATNDNGNVQQLKGKSLALANPQSLVALAGQKWLREQGLQPGRDFEIERALNDESLATLMRTGKAPLAIMSKGEFNAIGQATRETLKVVTSFATLPGFWVMLNPALDPSERNNLTALLLEFPKTDAGTKWRSLTGFSNIRVMEKSEQTAVDAFVESTRAGLK